jgi:hypothetical protein
VSECRCRAVVCAGRGTRLGVHRLLWSQPAAARALSGCLLLFYVAYMGPEIRA